MKEETLSNHELLNLGNKLCKDHPELTAKLIPFILSRIPIMESPIARPQSFFPDQSLLLVAYELGVAVGYRLAGNEDEKESEIQND